MGVGDRLGIVGEQPRRPQGVAEVVAGRRELVGHAAVDDDRAAREGIGEGKGGRGHTVDGSRTAAAPPTSGRGPSRRPSTGPGRHGARHRPGAGMLG